jgi:hypothetical protein
MSRAGITVLLTRMTDMSPIISLIVFSCFLLITVIALSLISYRLLARLLQFDRLFEMLVDDIAVNIEFFDKLSRTPVLSDVQEVKTAHHNMMIINSRLKEYVSRMGEASNRDLRPKTREVSKNPPVVV